MNMNAVDAFALFYEARAAKTRQFVEAREPINQSECDHYAMEAVINAVRKEVDKELVMRLIVDQGR